MEWTGASVTALPAGRGAVLSHGAGEELSVCILPLRFQSAGGLSC